MDGGGGQTVVTPPVDPAQQALEAAQADLLGQQTGILKQQAASQKVIEPFLYQSMGLNPQYDQNGNLVSLTQDPTTAANLALQRQITTSALQQQQAALTGQLPVNPLVSQELDKQRRQLNNSLSANLGPGYAASTPGAAAIAKLGTTQAGIIQAANQGTLSLDQQIAAASGGASGQTLAQVLQGTTGVNGLGFQTSGAFGQGAAGYGAAMQPYEFQSGQTLSANTATAGYRAQSSSGNMAGYGALAGAGITAAAIII